MAAPQRWQDDRDLPLSRWEDGTPVTRTQIRGLLAQAGVEQGLDVEVVGVHSLRAGGASAVFQASGGNRPLVQRLGRWAAEAFSGYIWEDRALTKGLANAMLDAPCSAHAGAY